MKERLSVEEVDLILSDSAIDRADINRFSRVIGFPASVFERFRRDLHDELGRRGGEDGNQSKVIEVERYLSENLGGRILYLPTYRRIEKDLKRIFPEIEEEIQAAISRRTLPLAKTAVYVELVNFGMEDVKSKLFHKLNVLKTQALASVNILTTIYLRDVIRNEANSYSPDLAKKIDDEALEAVFSKVNPEIISESDRESVYNVISKIRENKELIEYEKYVAHYVAYLLETADKITKLESPIREFVKICNSYLYGKSFQFDNIGYKVDIIDQISLKPIEMEDLSSGEKQIVSLFSHLMLDDDVGNYIIIDEPELSLSTDWQKRLLPDIISTKSCHFLGAVTHSPFISENELDAATIDLLDVMVF